MVVTTRRLRGDEGLRLRDIRLRALEEAPYAYATTHEEASQQTDADWIESAQRRAESDREATFVAEQSGQLVGLVGGLRAADDHSTVLLVAMWTAPEVRRQGVGRALVSAVVEWARSMGAARVELWVARGNDGAARLYEHVGFSLKADHRPLRSDPCKDEVRMALALDAGIAARG